MFKNTWYKIIPCLTALLLNPVAGEDINKIKDSAATETAQQPVALTSAPDTVYVIKESPASGFVRELKGLGDRIEKSRRQGYGGAGGWTPALLGVEMSPVRDLIAKEPTLRGLNFDIGRAVLMYGSGGMGYGGIGNGIRVGGYGFGGERAFTSQNAIQDTLTRLTVKVNLGGFMVEKAVVHDRMNLILGGMIGGGSISITRRNFASEKPSAFDLSEDESNGSNAEASLFVMGAHAGFTYSFISWFHAGADASLLGYYSSEGFGGPLSSFASGAGAFRVRLIWGNLG